MRPLLIFLLLPVFAAPVKAADYRPGAVSNLDWPDFDAPLPVSVPSNYTPDRKWPIIFHFHVSGLGPNVQVPRYYTEGRDFIIVGAEWTNDQPFLEPREFFEAEMERLRQIRAHLAKDLRVDTDRTYIGGVGLGGYYTSFLADLAMNELAGIYILSAGVFSGSKVRPIPFQGHPPVYIGAGQLEVNLTHSVTARGHFRGLGGQVTFDEFTGLDYTLPVPPNATTARLRQWFQVEANRDSPARGRALVAEWQELIQRKLEGLEKPIDRFLFLEHLNTFPFYPALPAAFRSGLEAEMKQLARLPEMEEELQVRVRYKNLAHEESKDFSIDNRRDIAHRYAALYKTYPDTYYGMRAGVSMVRLKDQIENPDRWLFQSEEQRRQFMNDIKERPLPDLNENALLQRMTRVGNTVFISLSPGQQ